MEIGIFGIYGSEELGDLSYGSNVVLNGGFDGVGNWAVTGESTVNTGVGRIYSSAGVASTVQQNNILVIGHRYSVEFDVVSTNGVDLSNNNGTVLYGTQDVGHKRVFFVAYSGDLVFKRWAGVTDVSIDNVSVREVFEMGASMVGDPVVLP